MRIAEDRRAADTRRVVATLPLAAWVLGTLALALGYVGFRAGVDYTAQSVWNREEYSHGLLIPCIAAFLVWQRRAALERLSFTGSWSGLVAISLAYALNSVGQLAALFILQQYSVLLALCGLVLALVGWSACRQLWPALALLFFMIPLPNFLYEGLSARLQLVSSVLGVGVIRQFGISVFLEGNVIDLGRMQLQVAEACSGLRYLFPLMTLGFIAAYFFQAALWKRLLVFFSGIPITIGMNSLRIGLIGVTVEYWGLRMAEGVLHDFEGWVIFMASSAVLLLEIIVLARIGRDRRPWRQVFGFEFPPPVPKGAEVVVRPIPRSFFGAVALLLAGAIVVPFLPERSDTIPPRRAFVDFPAEIAGRIGVREAMESQYMDELQLDDYLLADFPPVAAGEVPVNLYVAWYDTQRAGRSAHSPASCLPGGGWRIEDFSQVDLAGARVRGHPVRVNRALIGRGESRQLVYYFFKQRQRILTNEYAVKWFLFWDALTRNRTDGALVRYVQPLRLGDSPAEADRQLTAFAVAASAELAPFLPD